MIGHLLTVEADVFRPSLTGDGRGGRSRVFARVGSVRVNVSQPSAAEVESAAAVGVRLSANVHTLAGADVGRGDELRFGPRVLRVVSVVSDSHGTYTRLGCEERQSGA